MSSNGQSVNFGPYVLLGELGRGAMARVWRAWDPNLEREVAIKEPLFDSSISATMREEMGRRFVVEARTVARLQHPGIVTIYAADVYDGRPGIVMELIEGNVLSNYLGHNPMRPSEALDILDQLLDVVGYAHSQGVIHRDIKPDNIFVDRNGRVKLSDFGIAHVEGTGSTHATALGVVLGTPGYMSPEQARGLPVDARSDLFSIGVVGYEMLAGRHPFGGDIRSDPSSLVYRIVHEDPVSLPEDACEGLSVDVRPAIMAALSKSPTLRPQSADIFKRMLHGEMTTPVSAYAPTVPLPSAGSTDRKPQDIVHPPVPAHDTSKSSSWISSAVVAGICAVLAVAIFVVALQGTGGGGGGGGGGNNSSNNNSTTTNSTSSSTSSSDTNMSSSTQSSTSSSSSDNSSSSIAQPAAASSPVFTVYEASSTLPASQNSTDCTANAAFDGDIKTAWNTDGGHGIGASITMRADSEQTVSVIHIAGGYARSQDVYYGNDRPKDISIAFDDGTTVTGTLNDEYAKYQKIELPSPITTKSIKITINSSYEGSKYADNAISEIKVE